MVQREMEFRTLGVNESGVGLDDHDLSLWYQSRRGRQGGIVPPPPVLVLGSASGRVAALPYPPPKPFLIVAPCQHGRKDQSDQMACRAVSRAILLRSRAASSLRSRSAKIRTSRPANLSAGVI